MPSFIAWQARLNHRQIPGVAAAPVHALQVDDCLMRLSLSVRSLPPSGMSCCAIPFTGGQADLPTAAGILPETVQDALLPHVSQNHFSRQVPTATAWIS